MNKSNFKTNFKNNLLFVVVLLLLHSQQARGKWQAASQDDYATNLGKTASDRRVNNWALSLKDIKACIGPLVKQIWSQLIVNFIYGFGIS